MTWVGEESGSTGYPIWCLTISVSLEVYILKVRLPGWPLFAKFWVHTTCTVLLAGKHSERAHKEMSNWKGALVEAVDALTAEASRCVE